MRETTCHPAVHATHPIVDSKILHLANNPARKGEITLIPLIHRGKPVHTGMAVQGITPNDVVADADRRDDAESWDDNLATDPSHLVRVADVLTYWAGAVLNACVTN